MIEIEIDEPDGYLNKYNKNELSNELSDYILEECKEEKESNIINIKLNYRHKKTEEDNIKKILKNNFIHIKKDVRVEYEKKIKLNFAIFMFGILLLVLNHSFKLNYLFSEIIVVSSWVIIWGNTYFIIFESIKTNKLIRQLNKLICSDINIRK